MRPEVKFCGLTRPEDVDGAVEAGASYLGFVLADSPRRVSTSRLDLLTSVVPAGTKCVGVFAGAGCDEILGIMHASRLAVAQLHDSGAVDCAAALGSAGTEVWVATGVENGRLTDELDAMVLAADAIVLDTRVGKRFGGSGIPFDWAAVRDQLKRYRGRTRLVVAGGLTAENVGRAIAELDPDIVDVSSGIEAQPGIKDVGRMRAFMQAVRLAASP
ncbi:MAG: phosphoribosylanthranilate isomerase [Gemmatimonadota bacterium]